MKELNDNVNITDKTTKCSVWNVNLNWRRRIPKVRTLDVNTHTGVHERSKSGL